VTNRKPPPRGQKKTNPDKRVEAMRLLAEGSGPTDVARALKVGERTVRAWRDSPEGQRELSAARKAREAAFMDAAERARRILREGAEKAAQVLVDQLSSGDAATKSIAARTLLDRVGVPRVERREFVPPPADLSNLTDDELAELERLNRKIGRV